MDEEYAIKRDAQTLHSDMQTLVYENYNKFISATDTIKKVSLLLTSFNEVVQYLTREIKGPHVLII
jgi:Vps51/Vps67.